MASNDPLPGDQTRYDAPSAPVDPDATGYQQADPERTNYAEPGTKSFSGPSASDGDRTLPRRFGKYELLERIAKGGMGVVYRARELSPTGREVRIVALKMILAGADAGPEVLARFQTEAELAGRLDHPHIVPIYEVGECEGRPFYSMALIEGGSLHEHVKTLDRPLPAREAARLVQQVAEAVEAVHRAGAIHRDIKPQNILLQRQRSEPGSGSSSGTSPAGGSTGQTEPLLPKLTDFGLARTREGGGTATGEQLGTPSYMAPEQAAGRIRELGPATDVYGLGAVLYFTLTGRPPFQSADRLHTMKLVLEQEPVPVRELNPAAPRDLETVCLKCLHKEPARRYATARELAEDLGRFQRGEPVLARPVGRLERSWRWCRRNAAVASLLLLVAVLLLAGTTISTAYYLEADRERQKAQHSAGEARAKTKEANEERQKAERLAGERGEALEALSREKAEVQKQLARANFVNYRQLLREAEAAIARGRLDEAQDRLALCDPKLCGWEHDYLMRKVLPRLDCIGHTKLVSSVAFSPDGKRIASGGADKTVKVWDAATGQEALTLKGHIDGVSSVAFSPDGRRLASGSLDQTVKVWDAATGQEALTLKGHIDGVRSVAFSPDGKRLASASGDLIVGKSGEVKVWDARTGQEALPLKGHTGSVLSVAFSPDGKRIASGGADTTVKVWDAQTGQEALSLKGHTSGVLSVAFSPDGRRIASGSWDKMVKVWDAATGQEALSLKGHTDGVLSVAFSPDGKRIASASGDLIVGKPGEVKVWDAQTGQEALTLKGHTDGVSSVAFSPDGKHIASGGEDHTVKVWDAQTGQEALTLRGHTGIVFGVAFSPDGKRIASGGADCMVKVWGAATGQEALSLRGHAGAVMCVAYSPDGRRIASGGGEFRKPGEVKVGEVKVWDADVKK